METYKYSLIPKLIYRYANIPVTLLLLVYFLWAFFSPEKSWINGLSIVVHALLIYFINRFYYKNYKYFPYKIEINNEKMICSDYFLQNKKVEVNLIDIDDIKGGIFSNTPARPVYITDKKKDITIGLSPHIKGYNKLVTRILSNVSSELYDDVLNRIKEFGELNIKGARRKKKQS